MKLLFRITYQTSWGEEIKLVSGANRINMCYNPGGIWEISLPSDNLPAGTEYHYECWKDGRRVRREWRNHTIPATMGKSLEMNDSWTDIPAAAPFYTSAFADKVFAIDQDSPRFKVNADVTPESMYASGWKCAGTAVPVFSLRTEDSFGIGDFHDLKKLVDWVVATGQRVIQLLPVNDTTMTGTWVDTYPYSANSIYALHPQFVYLPDAGVRRDSSYKALKAELEALPELDYERVNAEKDRLMRKAFSATWAKVSKSPEYKEFVKVNANWLDAYCAFRILLHKTGTGDTSKWGKYASYSEKKVAAVLAADRAEADYHAFVQFHLHKQLVEARDYARKRGVALKGDLPIGVSRTSVDAWQNPSQFNMNSQAGAPPDAFSADGQMWGFPTYNWDKMEEDNFAWWKARLKNMEQYFDFFRIDHILGFFRIWEIPTGASSGLLGHFNPALPYSSNELADKGFDVSTGWYTSDGLDTLFLEDSHRKGYWYPRIAAQNTDHYHNLPDWQKDAFNRLYDDFFYRRHNAFWRDSALRKLPDLLAATRMLACGEDLGMIPDCVPSVMDELRILSLEIQRMPKDVYSEFANTWGYPYLSVCATSTHDMSPLRAWWHEDRGVTQRFWNQVLGKHGEAPSDCTPDISRSIIMMHLQSVSMLAILPLQDYLSLKPELCLDDPNKERVNNPAISPYYWRFRMKPTLEALIADDITPYIRTLVRDCGRK